MKSLVALVLGAALLSSTAVAAASHKFTLPPAKTDRNYTRIADLRVAAQDWDCIENKCAREFKQCKAQGGSDDRCGNERSTCYQSTRETGECDN